MYAQLARRCAVVAAWLLILVSAAAAGRLTRADAPDFQREIRPLLAARCFACHGPDAEQREAGLRLDEAGAAVAELPSGARAIVPGERAASAIFERITSTDEATRMPPEGGPLSAEEIDRIGRWIDAGAEYAAHWAYVAPVRPGLPAVHDRHWPTGPIDRFVLAKLEEQAFRPAPPAERARLIRRATLDLTGLPPTVAEVDSVSGRSAGGRVRAAGRSVVGVARVWAAVGAALVGSGAVRGLQRIPARRVSRGLAVSGLGDQRR